MEYSPLAAPLGVKGAAAAALDDMAEVLGLAGSKVGVNAGDSTFKAFF